MGDPTRVETSFGCDAVVPDPSMPPHRIVSRWSDSGVERPALVVVPRTEADIVDAISYSKRHELHVAAASGGHGSFLPVDANSLYLDMTRFNSIDIHKSKNVVRLGGGVLAGDLLVRLCEAGYYALTPNSKSVGMTGFVLGGGNPAMLGLHGLAMDHVISFRLVTSDGKTLHLSAESTGDELALFHALCGAGYGFGVVTSMEIDIFPLGGLRMPDNKYWTRRLLFKGADIDTVARVFSGVRPCASLTIVVGFVRSPPGSPGAGSPLVMMLISYFGPPEEAEKEASFSLDEEIAKKAISVGTFATPYNQSMDAFDTVSEHGGYRRISSTWLKIISPEAITAVYQKWSAFTEDIALQRTMAYINVSNTKISQKLGSSREGKARYFESRERAYCAFTLTIHDGAEKEESAQAFADECKSIYRRGQPESDLPRTFANNVLPETDPAEIHTEDRVAELRRLKRVWDSTGLFWSPWLK